MLKRIFDTLLSGFFLLISFPIWVLSSIAIIMESGGPVFIKQERVGIDGKIFHILKFRSMDKEAHMESPTEHIENRNCRITKAGEFLRATAMDELPQLLSIFIGKMSFVGPRPVHPKESVISGGKYENLFKVPDFDRRTSIKPGLTGIAQVYAKKDFPIEQKVKYDLLYLKKQSLWLDIKLILLSFWVTFRGKWESKDKKL